MFKARRGTRRARQSTFLSLLLAGLIWGPLPATRGQSPPPTPTQGEASASAVKPIPVGEAPAGGRPQPAGLLRDYRGAVGIRLKGTPVGISLDSDGEITWLFGFAIPLKYFELNLEGGRKKPEVRPSALGVQPSNPLAKLPSVRPFASTDLEKQLLRSEILKKDMEIRALKAELDALKTKQLLMGTMGAIKPPAGTLKPQLVPAPPQATRPNLFEEAEKAARNGSEAPKAPTRSTP